MTQFFCVSLIRSVLLEAVATSSVCGNSVKRSFTESIEYVCGLTGMSAEEVQEFLPSEYTYAGSVFVRGKYIPFTATKSRYELYPIISG